MAKHKETINQRRNSSYYCLREGDTEWEMVLDREADESVNSLAQSVSEEDTEIKAIT